MAVSRTATRGTTTINTISTQHTTEQTMRAIIFKYNIVLLLFFTTAHRCSQAQQQQPQLIMLRHGRDPVTNDELCIAAEACEKGSCGMLTAGSTLKLSRCHRISQAQLWFTNGKRIRTVHAPEELCVHYSGSSNMGPVLKDCADSGSNKKKKQKWKRSKVTGHIVPKEKTSMCLTYVKESASSPQSGDMVTVERCDPSSSTQEWDFIDPVDCLCLDGLAKNCSVPAYSVVEKPAKKCRDMSLDGNPHAYWNNRNFNIHTDKRPCSTGAEGYALVSRKRDADIEMELGDGQPTLYFSSSAAMGRDDRQWGVGEVWPLFTDSSGNLIDPKQDDVPCVRFYSEGEWKTLQANDTDHDFPDRNDYKFGSLECCERNWPSDRRFFIIQDGTLIGACGVNVNMMRSC